MIILQQRGSENLGEGIYGEYVAKRGQKGIQRKVDVVLRNADAKAAQSLRGSRVPVEGRRNSVVGSRGVSLGGKKSISRPAEDPEETHRNTQEQ